MTFAEQYAPFAPVPLQNIQHYYGTFRPCVMHWYSRTYTVLLCLNDSLNIITQVPTFLTKAKAELMPPLRRMPPDR